MIMKKTIWIFREERSGSTALTNLIASRLGILNYFMDPNFIPPPASNDATALFDTHYFPYLENMSDYDNPLLIRCTRKNRVEQYLSQLMVRWMKKTVYRTIPDDELLLNFRTDTKTKFEQLFFKVVPTVITKRDLITVHTMFSEKQKLWEKHAKLYPNCTVYYEDLCEGIDIPLLGLTDCKLTDELVVQKLPDYKERIFLNYDMIVSWTQELIDKDSG
jgi:hypothetical protein